MDNTAVKNKVYSNQFINGETVSYTISYAFSFIILIIIKQIFKLFFGVNASAAYIVGFVIAEAVLYLTERFFIYKGNIFSSDLRQIIFAVLNSVMHFGLFKGGSAVSKKIGLADYTLWFVLAVLFFIINYPISRILIFNCKENAENITGSKLYGKVFNNRFIIFSMAGALIAMGFVFAVYKVFPFGDTTVLRMDLYHQYGPLFVELYDRITDFRTFLYSWTSGGGSGFLGNYFNYLSSPLNFLIILFNRDQMPFAISFLVALKCVISAGTFTFYIKKSQKQHSLISAAFGMLYSFSAYMLAYFWNIMWLDGMMMLPLIVLGIENIINKGKCRLYIISLIYILYSSYYIGYMTCIFSVIYFIAYFAVSYNSKNVDTDFVSSKKFSLKKLYNNQFINRGIKFAFSSVLAAALCAFFLVPVYYILSGCSATSDSFPNSAKAYFTVLDFIQNHFAALETTIRSSGDNVLPNMYCGVLTLILLLLFVINRKIKLREKFVYISLLLIFFASFNSNYLNFIWHAFHFPNDLPYRFSYMYSFILLVIGIKSFKNIRAVGIKEIGFTAFLWIAFIAISQELKTNKITDFSIYATIAFIIVWAAVLFIIKSKKFSSFVAGVLVIAVSFCEIIVCDTNSFGFNQTLSNYNENYNIYTEASDHIEENDKSFYRTELCHLNTRMDPCIYDYRGMSAFSSMAYENYSRLQHNLGMYGNRINSYTYNPQTPVYNLMYSIKYLIYNGEDVKPSTDLYTRAYETENYAVIYENDYFLPLAYCVNPAVEDWETIEGNPFQIQSDFFALATGFSDVFSKAKIVSVNHNGIGITGNSENITYQFNKHSDTGEIEVNCKAVKNGNFYLYISSSDIRNITCEYNDTTVTQTVETPYILDLGYVNANDTITVKINANALKNDNGSLDIYAYSLNKNVLDAGYRKLYDKALDITEHIGTKIKGRITCNESSMLYSSIPYDESWSVYIDGIKQQTFKIADSQLGVMITAGEHTIEYKYRPKGLTAGILISAATLAALAGYEIIKRKNKIKQ